MLIEDLTSSGEGVGTLDGKKVFVDGALPSEEVDIEITSEKKRFSKAKLVQIRKASNDRVNPVCPLFGTCGGCQIMHLDYPAQLKWKQKRIKDAFLRIGKIDFPVSPCIPSPDPLGYRNKIHLHEGGFYKKHSHDVVQVDKCYIHSPIGEKALPLVKDAKEAIIKSSLDTGEVLLVVDGKSDKPFITEKLGNLRFQIRGQDFFQINPKQAVQLYEKAIQCAQLDRGMRVLDGYCGVGTLSLFAAQKAKSVLGIEQVGSAIKSARENAKLNSTSNVEFKLGKVEDELPKLGSFDAIFLNPPRAGVDPKVIHALLKHPPKRLIYISCDPATLSRDLSALEEKFAIEGVVPFDMFPQTVHVETLVSLVFSS